MSKTKRNKEHSVNSTVHQDQTSNNSTNYVCCGPTQYYSIDGLLIYCGMNYL